MILFIDTTDYTSMRLALVDNTVTREHVFKIEYNENWKTLDYLNKFFQSHQLSPATKFSKIIVCSGPGSFTGTRVGVTIAQALAFANGSKLIAIPKNKIPKDLKKLTNFKGNEKLKINYSPSKFD